MARRRRRSRSFSRPRLAPNAELATASAISAALDKLARRYPADMRHQIVLDSTTFVKATIVEVLRTLAEAFGLVVLVVFLFLGSWRATLVPIIAVPVSLIGAFAVLFALRLFGPLTPSAAARACARDSASPKIDDANRKAGCQNVERIMEEEGLPPAEAARKAMREITGPIIAITLVLLSVFVPVGLYSRHHRRALSPVRGGRLRRGDHFGDQCADPSPALCALVLRPGGHRGLMAYPLGVIARIQSGYAGHRREHGEVSRPGSARRCRDRVGGLPPSICSA